MLNTGNATSTRDLRMSICKRIPFVSHTKSMHSQFLPNKSIHNIPRGNHWKQRFYGLTLNCVPMHMASMGQTQSNTTSQGTFVRPKHTWYYIQWKINSQAAEIHQVPMVLLDTELYNYRVSLHPSQTQAASHARAPQQCPRKSTLRNTGGKAEGIITYCFSHLVLTCN